MDPPKVVVAPIQERPETVETPSSSDSVVIASPQEESPPPESLPSPEPAVAPETCAQSSQDQLVCVFKRTPYFQRRALDLFSGTGSVGRRIQEWGFEVTSVDIDPSTKPTYVVDILKWDYKKLFIEGYFDLIAAGVPCTEYSRAKTNGNRNFPLADKIVNATLALIDFFKPKAWWIENPR